MSEIQILYFLSLIRCRLDRKGLESEPLLERYRDLNLADLQLQRFDEVYWRGMRRDKKDYSEREREHRADHLLLVFDRYLVFLEKGPADGSSLQPGGLHPGQSLPALYMRPLTMLDVAVVRKSSSIAAPAETKKRIVQLCPIIELAAVMFMADARGLCYLHYPFHSIRIDACPFDSKLTIITHKPLFLQIRNITKLKV